MKRSGHLWNGLLAAGALYMVVCSQASAIDAEAQAECRPEAHTATPAGQPGMWAYFDPQTGRLGVPPPQAAGAAAGASVPSSSGPGLIVVPAPGGGEMMDLQGRFKMAATARLKPGGAIETDCHSSGGAGGR